MSLDLIINIMKEYKQSKTHENLKFLEKEAKHVLLKISVYMSLTQNQPGENMAQGIHILYIFNYPCDAVATGKNKIQILPFFTFTKLPSDHSLFIATLARQLPQVFPHEFCELFKNTYSVEDLRMAGSETPVLRRLFQGSQTMVVFFSSSTWILRQQNLLC